MRRKSIRRQFQDPFAKREAQKYDNPIASRELIEEILATSHGPLSHRSLCEKLKIESDEQVEALRRRLIAMERDGQLIKNRKGAYGLIDKMDLIRGRVQGHRDGFGFVIPFEGEGDIYLTNRQMRKVFDGDEVLVRSDGVGPNGKREGSIVEILAHNTQQVVGRYVNDRGIHIVRPDNPRNCHDILIPPEEVARATDGQFVVVEIVQQPSRYQRPVGRVVEVLGDHMAPGMEIDVAIRSHNIPHTWPEDVQQQAKNFSDTVNESDKKHRIDLRKLPLVTIDGEDARDFDDAVYCEKKSSGGWRLYVAIADVSHYVAVGSPLDKEAAVRGTSVYFPDFVVPMLPHVLSNGLCSLNPKVDRLCMVCEMTVSAQGKVSGFQFYEGVMHSQARLTYTEVGKVIAEKSNPNSTIRQQYANVVEHLDNLYGVYLALRNARVARGAIDFESKETRIIFDEDRKIERIVPIERNDAHKLIEECMLAANVSTAKLLETLKVPTLYRVHEGPRAEKLEMLFEFLSEIGLSMKGLGEGGEVTPQHYRDVLLQAEGRADQHIIQTVMLRSMNQAVYQPANVGHFGLAYQAYAHFTSPIRRYPDLLVHRAIRALLRSNTQSKHLRRADKKKGPAFNTLYPYNEIDMSHFGEQSSLCERRADEATREVISWLKCEYLRNHVGEEFDGVVSAVTGFGLFVELQDLYIEGLVHVTSLPHDYYHFEAAKHRLVGERTRKTFHLGDELRVQVMRVDLDERKIDFELIASKASGRRKASQAQPESEQQVPTKKTVRKRKPQSSETTGAAQNASVQSADKTSTPKKTAVEKKTKKKAPSKKAAAKHKASSKKAAVKPKANKTTADKPNKTKKSKDAKKAKKKNKAASPAKTKAVKPGKSKKSK